MIEDSSAIIKEHETTVRERCKVLVDSFFKSMGSIDAQIIYIEWMKRNKHIDCDQYIQELLEQGPDNFFSTEEKEYIAEEYLKAPTTNHQYDKENISQILDMFVAYLEYALDKDRSNVLSHHTRKYDFDMNSLNGMNEEDLSELLKKTAIVSHQLAKED